MADTERSLRQSAKDFSRLIAKAEEIIETVKNLVKPSPPEDNSKPKAENAAAVKRYNEDLKKMKLARAKAGKKRTTGVKRKAAAKGGEVSTSCRLLPNLQLVTPHDAVVVFVFNRLRPRKRKQP
jgi:hypothetical protein